jgi:CRISPR-associated protein Cas2
MATQCWHLIRYDVRDPKRLRRVAKLLEGYGTRVQYSIFRCRLDHLSLEKLHWELNQIMESEDDLLVIPLSATRRRIGCWPSR